MRNRKRLFSLLLTVIIMLSAFPLEASANSPEPTPYYTFYLSNLPEGTVYVDLLIWLPETDEMYTELVTDNIPDSFSQHAEILTYCENDYRSYTFHYANALSMLKVHEDGYVRYFADDLRWWDEVHIRFDHADEINGRGDVKLAMLDAQGNILFVSEPLNLLDVNRFSYILGRFYYDAATGELIIDHIENNLLDPPEHYIVSSVAGILLTCVLEWLTSLVFDIKGYRRFVIFINVVSQILMRLAYAALYLYSSFGYLTITLMLEISVMIGEFLFYRRTMKRTSWITSLIFVICANVISWFFGHIINLIVFFGAFIMI